jgi:hypothetical protein
VAIEPAEEFLGSDGLGLRRGKLDGQWNSVQPATDLGDSLQLVMNKIQVASRRAGTVDEKLDGVGAPLLLVLSTGLGTSSGGHSTTCSRPRVHRRAAAAPGW